MGIGAFLGGIITRTPECRHPRIAPPRASTIKLTRNLNWKIELRNFWAFIGNVWNWYFLMYQVGKCITARGINR